MYAAPWRANSTAIGASGFAFGRGSHIIALAVDCGRSIEPSGHMIAALGSAVVEAIEPSDIHMRERDTDASAWDCESDWGYAQESL